ncbi:hypothetical protein TWF718_008327 [Orbilia javanica]|uniref:Uncharacterized protein n=1 Tax=Orbilia javanica TaxID=47235 RepID=A0AAN8MSG8_9PEZI
MQLLFPALLLGSLIQSTVVAGYGPDRGRDNNYGKAKTVTHTKYVTKYKTFKTTSTKVVSIVKTIRESPGDKDIESYAAGKGLTCIKPSETKEPTETTEPPSTEPEPAWVKNCPASVTLTAVPKCPAIRCMADPDCPAYDEALPIEWDCRCKDRPPTTTRVVKPCPSCCPPPPVQRHDISCLGRMSHLPIITADEPKPTQGIAVGEKNPAAPKEEEEPKEDKEAPKDEEPVSEKKKPAEEPADDEKKDDAPMEETAEKADD